MAVPSNAPPGSVGAQPLASGLATSDYFLGWQPNVFPASSVLVQNSQFIGLDHSAAPVTAQGSATSGALSFWAGMLAGSVSGAIIASGTISNTAIVATSLTVTGALVANGAVSGSGITTLFASPPAIGGTTPAGAVFTDLTVGTNTATQAQIYIDAAATDTRALYWLTAGNGRWALNLDNTAESGSNAGADFQIQRYSDAGTVIDTPFAITRSTGVSTASSIVVNGASTLGNGNANYLVIDGAATGSGPTLTATGSDTNINVHAVVKGTGVFETLRGSFGTSNGSAALFDGSAALYVAANPTFSGSAGPAINAQLSVAGSATTGSPFLNVVAIADTVNASGISGSALSGLYVDHVLNAGFEGGRIALNVGMTIAGAPGASAGGNFFSAIQLNGTSNVNVGGTSGLSAGYLSTQSIQTTLNSGATYFSLVEAIEMGLTINTGASSLYANVFKISSGSPVAGVNSYSGIAIGSSGPGLGFLHGICFAPGETTANPIQTTGTLIGSQTANGATLTAAYGMDFSLWTFSTAFLKSTGFVVTGAGAAYSNLTSATITSTVGVTLTAAQVVGSVIFRTNAPTGAFTDTTDTATNIIAAIPGATVNASWKLRYVNRDNNVATIAGGTGVTISGTATVANNTWRDFLCQITNIGTPAVTMTSMGAGTAT